MNEQKKLEKIEKKTAHASGIKYTFFIAIPVIIILVALGFYYARTNPVTILTKTIDESSAWIEKLANQNSFTFQKNDPINVTAAFNISTDLDLDGLEKILAYNYQVSYKKFNENEQTSIQVSDQDKEIININYYNINGENFLESKKLFSKLIKIPQEENETVSQIIEQVNSFPQISKEDGIYLINQLKKYFIQSINKKYINREKTDINIDDKTIKATKITYLLNKENQKRTLDYIKNAITEDDRFLEILSKIMKIEKKELIGNLQKEEEYEYNTDYKITLYTEGLNQKVIKVNLEEDDVTVVSYTNTEEKKINFKNEVIIKINELSEKNIDIDFELKEQNCNGSLKLTLHNNEIDAKISIKTKENYFDINTTITLGKETFILPNTSNVVSVEDLTETDILTILENLEKSLEGTTLLQLFEQNIL